MLAAHSRELQEAYAVFLFIKLVFQFGGGEKELKRKLVGCTVDQPWPFDKCMAPSKTDGLRHRSFESLRARSLERCMCVFVCACVCVC